MPNGLAENYKECGSVTDDWPVLPGDMEPIARTKRQSLQPIRIEPYYIVSDPVIRNLLRADDGPVAHALNYFQNVLSVIPFQQNLRAPSSADTCGPHATIPRDHTRNGVANADYLLYITAVESERCETAIAYAGPCYVDTTMGNRPFMGAANFCPSQILDSDLDYVKIISLHEITHALVFVTALIERFPLYSNALSQQRINGQDVSIVTTPKVVQAARDHYNCPTLRGVPLENHNGGSAHWESRIIFPELMNGGLTSSLANTTAISRLTLSLFEDSGWYTVNYEAGLAHEELLSGSDEGCDFITTNCNSTSYPYSCTSCCELLAQCTHDYQAAGICLQFRFFDSCPVLVPLRFCTDVTAPPNINISAFPPGAVLDFGPQSICVETNRDPDFSTIYNCVVHDCFQIEGTELVAFTLTFNSQTEWCYPDGTVNNGQLLCPPVKFACARGDIEMLSPTDPIPPPLCDSTCASCTVAQNPAFCQSCADGRRLNGNDPTSCLSNTNPCSGSTYLNSSGDCAACPTGCSLCRGSQNSACLACENTDLYRDTTNMLNTACVSQCGAGTAHSIDVFGVRTCIGAGSGAMGTITGASSIAYIMMMLILITLQSI